MKNTEKGTLEIIRRDEFYDRVTCFYNVVYYKPIRRVGRIPELNIVTVYQDQISTGAVC